MLYGTGEEWIRGRIRELASRDPSARISRRRRRSHSERPLFRFQYKGLYPALEEASQLSPRLRGRLEHFVGEIDCSECGGSRLRDDAAAVRFRDRTIDEIGRTAAGRAAGASRRLEARRRTRRKSPAS